MLPENKPNHIVLNKLVIITTKKHNDYIDIMSMWANNRILLKQCAQYNNGIITPICVKEFETDNYSISYYFMLTMF